MACLRNGIAYVARSIGRRKGTRAVVATLLIVLVIRGRRFMVVRGACMNVKMNVIAMDDGLDRRLRRRAARLDMRVMPAAAQ